MKLIVSKEINSNIWSEFVLNHPHGNIFQTPEMYEVYENTKEYEPVFVSAINEKGEILGILLAVIQKEYSGILGNFTARSVIFGGPLIKNNDADVLDYILKEYDKTIKKKAIYSQFRNFWDWGDLKEIFIKNGFEYEEHLDILFDLTQSEDELLKQMHKERRHNIRRAINKGTTFKELTNKQEIEGTYIIIKNTYKRVRLPFPDKSLFDNAYEILYKKGMVKYFAAFNSNVIIGIRVVLCYKNVIYDWYAGSDSKYLNKYPNDFLPWEVILWSKKNSYKVFDFGGAGKPDVPYGVRNYKLKFGGELVNFGRFKKMHKPFLYNIAKIGFKLYQGRNIGLRK